MTDKSQKNFSMKKILLPVLAILVMVLVNLFFFWRLPYYIEMPGSAEDVQQFVTVDGKKNENIGAYLMTTVSIKQATPAGLLFAQFSDFNDVITEEELLGEGTNEEYDKLSALEMKSSENMAKKVALDLAGIPNEFLYKGIYVLSVSDDSDFKDKLQMGDIVYQVDDLTFQSTEAFTDYLTGKKKNDKIELKIIRNNQEKTVSGKLIKLKEQGTVGVGITLVEHNELTSDVDVTFDVEGIGGPSAGLMFTLEIYDSLTGKSLRQGHVIAGTGTIEADGKVGMIGGIDKKVVAADREGAEVFFAPAEEYSEATLKEEPDLKNNYETAVEAAKKIGTDMKIVPVKNIQDAINYMKNMSPAKQ